MWATWRPVVYRDPGWVQQTGVRRWLKSHSLFGQRLDRLREIDMHRPRGLPSWHPVLWPSVKPVAASGT